MLYNIFNSKVELWWNMSQETMPGYVELSAGEISQSGVVAETVVEPEIAVVMQLAPAEVTESLDRIRKGDTYDIFRPRINGTSVLAGRALIPATPTAVIATIFESRNFGPQTVLLTGTAAAAGTALVAATVYGGKRALEQRRAVKREQDQDVIRDYLHEPVDIMRGRNRGKHKGVSMRWYGADKAHADQDQNNGVVGRLAKVAEFAEEQQFASVVVSAGILDKASDEAARTRLKAKYEDNFLTTKELFKSTKGSALNDRTADAQLLRLSPSDARGLAKELSKATDANNLKVLTSLLVGNNQNHIAANLIQEWKALGEPPELLGALRKLMAESIGRELNKKVEFHTVTTRYDGHIKNSETGELEEADWRMSSSVEANLAVTPKGIYERHTAILPDDTSYAQGRLTSFSEHTISGQDANELIQKYVKLVEANPIRKDKDGKEIAPVVDDLLNLEIALYKRLCSAVETDADTTSLRIAGSTPTLYERMPQERVRGFMRPWAPRRGKVSKEDQTIEYSRLFWRNFGKKVGATALAAGIGLGAGIITNKAWGNWEMWQYSCLPEYHKEKPLTKKELAECEAADSSIMRAIGGTGEAIYDANSAYEDWVITRLYTSGILTPDTLSDFSNVIDHQWAEKKFSDLAGRYNLYDGDYTPISDAPVDVKGSAPSIWKLTPQNNAPVDGYWPSSMQDTITLNPSLLSESTPPLDGQVVDILDDSQRYAPLGAELIDDPYYQGEITRIREFLVPASPKEDDRPLIHVQGRQLTTRMDNISVYDTETNSWNNTLQALPLPVREGGDIVAARFIARDMSTDEVIKEFTPSMYQKSNGVFGVVLDTPNDMSQYVDVEYWVDPTATTDLPLKAERPMQILGSEGKFISLDRAYAEADIEKVLTTLGLTKDATLDEVAQAIRTKYEYSYTPYKDSGKKKNNHIVDQNNPNATVDAVRLVAEYSADMGYVHCNISALLEIFASRGNDDTEFINKESGFRNANADNSLSQTESHVYTRTNTGRKVDPTPQSKPDRQSPSVREYQDSPRPASETTLQTVALGLAGLLAFGGSAIAGNKIVPQKIDAIRSRRGRRRYHGALEELAEFTTDADALDTFREDIAVLNYALYGGAVANAKDISTYIEQMPADSADPKSRLMTLPFGTKRTLRDTHKFLNSVIDDGAVTVTNEQRERLHRILDTAHTIKTYDPEVQTSVF